MGSPPPRTADAPATKNWVPKFRSRSRSRAADPSTGTKSALRIAVSQRPHIVSGSRMYPIPGARMRITVVT